VPTGEFVEADAAFQPQPATRVVKVYEAAWRNLVDLRVKGSVAREILQLQKIT
jgi:hypothetical protein